MREAAVAVREKERGTDFPPAGEGGNITWMSGKMTFTPTCNDPNGKLTTQPLWNIDPPERRERAHQDHMAEVLIWSRGCGVRKGWQHAHPLVH